LAEGQGQVIYTFYFVKSRFFFQKCQFGYSIESLRPSEKLSHALNVNKKSRVLEKPGNQGVLSLAEMFPERTKFLLYCRKSVLRKARGKSYGLDF